MNEQNEAYDMHFFQLVFSLQAGAMQQMGKIASSLTGKVERDLNLAKASIDMLDMLQRKTEGNLSPDEKRLIEHTLYELRLNYVEEVKKGDTPSEGAKDTKSTGNKAETGNKLSEKPPENEAESDPQKGDK
ncbi:MAG: DUF1844 domain-containing protein [candidate division Zixibacteria bacterium]|nr:DUF1844 domain-containing protein [candidate division Zixibacteria bacterium]